MRVTSPPPIYRHLFKGLGLFLLAGTLSACLGGGGGSSSDSASDDTVDVWPSATLPASAALNVDDAEFLPSSLLRDWHIELDAMGNRPAGSDIHESYTDALYERLSRAGVEDLYYEDVELDRWLAESWSLAVQRTDTEFEEVTAAAYVPYSGNTPEEGINAELEYLTPEQAQQLLTGRLTFAELAPTFAGKIALIDYPRIPVTQSYFTVFTRYDPANLAGPDDVYDRTFIPISAFIGLVDGLEAIGAKGLVTIFNGSPDADLAKLYVPYDSIIRNIPGVYVDATTGAQLRNEAAVNSWVNLKLSANVETVTTRNLIGIIPGASDELVVINSHTDGTNGAEDNAPNVIVDIAQYLTRLPKESLDRSIMIMMSSGHFVGGKGIKSFLKQHEDDGLLDRISAVVTVEHMGLNEWLFDDEAGLKASGIPEPGSMFMPNQQPLIDAAIAWAEQSDSAPTNISPPTNPDASGDSNDAVWPGEGQYFWGLGGIPTINYITGPAYLLHWDVDTVDFVDFDLLHRQTVATTQMLLDLGRVPMEDLPRRQ